MTEIDFKSFIEDNGANVKKYMTQYFHNEIKSICYHYTNCDNLISIIQNNELWLSNIEYLNDKLEIKYSIEVFKEALNKSEINQDNRNEFLKSFIDNKKKVTRCIYVLSLSMDGDSLNTWNNYGKNDGYNIGFDKNKFIDYVINNKLLIKDKSNNVQKDEYIVNFGNVLYDRTKQVEYFKSILNIYNDFIASTMPYREQYKALIHEEIGRIWNNIIICSYLIKQDSHRVENEYRLALFVVDRKMYCYRSRNGVILPYIKLCGDENTNFPISIITIGPKINEEIAKKGLKIMLSTNYRKVKIMFSDIKLRF